MNEPKTTEELIREILESSKDNIAAQLREGIKQQVISQLSWSMREQITAVTNEFVKTQMTEDITKAVQESKPLILEGLKEAFVKIGAEVATAMYTQAAKNLNVNSYKVQDIIKKILD